MVEQVQPLPQSGAIVENRGGTQPAISVAGRDGAPATVCHGLACCGQARARTGPETAWITRTIPVMAPGNRRPRAILPALLLGRIAVDLLPATSHRTVGAAGSRLKGGDDRTGRDVFG
jgi:hypothetical protein